MALGKRKIAAVKSTSNKANVSSTTVDPLNHDSKIEDLITAASDIVKKKNSGNKINFNKANISSTRVDPLTHDSKFENLIPPAVDTGREKLATTKST